MSDDRQEILAANQAFYRAFEKKDIEAMSAIWSQGIGTVCIHPGRSALRGPQAIRQSWEQIFKYTSYIEIDMEVISNEANGDLGYVVLVENLLQVSGGRRIQAQSIATNIFERMGNNWYLVSHHGSPVMN
ncbi:MAG: nuclear transport factor 2 family protein [Oscillatoriaceae cyanobacterium Prado104]|jgi:ketosteroid isomerase-like protein|nr:nuclear transport factor 2 family protein [Oscillatoriaceae cyanobacterium Prado104]